MTGRVGLNTDLVRRRRGELGLSIRQVAAEIGVTATGYIAIENGGGNPDIGLDAAQRLSSVLGVCLDDLVGRRREAQHHGDREVAQRAGDAARLGALLAAAGTLTPTGALLEVLDWDLERLHGAEAALGNRLAAVGMVLRRSMSRLAIERDPNAVDAATLEQSLRRHLGRDHMSITEARMLRCVKEANVTAQPSNPERVALGTLINAGLVTFGEARAPTAESPLELSKDVRFGLRLDEIDRAGDGGGADGEAPIPQR